MKPLTSCTLPLLEQIKVLVFLPVAVEPLEPREHEHVVVGLLVQFAAPVPRRGQSAINTRPAVVTYK